MSVFSSPRYTRHSFTLVEMLTVIVIIGILAGLITAAATRARYRAKVTVIHAELEQLEMALHAYKEKFGEFPPDFTNQDAVLRHLRKAFPRCSVTNWTDLCTHVSNEWGVDLANMDSANALIFWLGGKPEWTGGGNVPIARFTGFSANPRDPFDDSASRMDPFFDFDTTRIAATSNRPRYYSPYCEGDRTGPPIFYFRAENGGYSNKCWNSGNVWVHPYRDSRSMASGDMTATDAYTNDSDAVWVNSKTFQILSPGFDEKFYTVSGASADSSVMKYYFPNNPNGFDDVQFDDMANFTPGTIEDAMD